MLPTRYFLGRPDVGEEMHISIEKGKTLIVRLMAIGPVIEGRAQRDVWFEVNGEVILGTFDVAWGFLLICNSLGRRYARYQLRTRILQWRQSHGRRQPLTQVRSVHPCQALSSRSESRKVRRSRREILFAVSEINPFPQEIPF